jgi:antitoxin PrlF
MVTENDPILDRFLVFLEQDMEKNFQHLRALDSAWISRIQALVADVDLNLTALLSSEDE